jgi:hypothetical protein
MSMEDKLIKTAIHPEHGRGTIIKETEERLFVKWENSDHPSGWFMRIDMEYVVVEGDESYPIAEDGEGGFGITIPPSIDFDQFDLNLMDQMDPPPIVSPNSIMLSQEEEDDLVRRIEKTLRDDSEETLKDDEE